MPRLSRKVVLLCFFNISFVIFLMMFVQKTRVKVLKKVEIKMGMNFEVLESLRLFSRVTERFANVCLIEPRLLWNHATEKQELLRRKGFDISRHRGPPNAISLAVFEEDVWRLMDVDKTTLLESSGFRILVQYSEEGRLTGGSHEDGRREVVQHLFYLRHRTVIHVVVFRKELKYFWSWKLNINVEKSLIPKNISFGRADAVFERFELVPYLRGGVKMRNIFIPSNIPAFLTQLETSSFVSCKNVNKDVGVLSTSEPNEEEQEDEERPPLWVFVQTTQSVIEELKNILDPSLTPFWLASGTLLGWYRECGLIPFTSDLDFAAWAVDLKQGLIQAFENNRHIKLKYVLGKLTEDAEFWMQYKWLNVDLFFVYDNNTDNFHVGAHRPGMGYSFKYIYPKFSLCSTVFLGYKVLVPCDPEAVIRAEYGDDWWNPKEEWNYEISARNVRGRRYWGKEEVKNFQKYING